MTAEKRLPDPIIVEAETRHGKIRGHAEHVARWVQICADSENEERKWIADLRSIGIKAAHPDDGHVNRKRGEYHDFVKFCYPQFNDGVKEGDRIALGWPDCYRVRLVQRVTMEGWLFGKEPVYQVVK